MKTYGQRYGVRRHTAALQAQGEVTAAPIQYDPPRLPNTVYATTDDKTFPSIANKLLKADIRAQPLTVYIDTLGTYGRGDQIVLVIDNAEYDPNNKHTITQEEKDQGLVELSLPAALRTAEGAYSLQYRFYSKFLPTEPGITSPTTTFITDYTRPGRPYPGSLIFDDPTLVSNGLNAAKLAQLGDQVTAQVPSYEGAADGDAFVAELALHMGGGTVIQADSVQIDQYDPTKDIKIAFSGDMIRANGDGLTEFRYYITDMAGNRSETSTPVLISVFVSGAVDDLAPPLVPLYQNLKPLDETAARTPILVDIPGNARLAAGDKILAYWGKTALQPPIIVTDPTLQVMLSIPVPYKTVQDEGNGAVTVTYEAYRGTSLLGAPAQGTNVVVNIQQPGGQDPDPDTLENEALSAPILHAFGWVQGDQPNSITVEQSKNDAVFIVPWLNTATPQVPSFQAGDVIDCYYATTKIGTITVSSADVGNGKDLTTPVPANVIQTLGSGRMPIHYVASRTSAINPGETPVTNSAISVSTVVTVESAGDLPGGENGLPAPAFGVDIIGFVAAQNGVQVTIPDYLNKAVGDEVTVIFKAYFMDTSTLEVGAEIVKASYAELKHVGPDDLNASMAFTIPSSRALYLFPMAEGHLQFSAKNSHGSVTSTPAVTIVCDTRGNNNPPDDRDDPS